MYVLRGVLDMAPSMPVVDLPTFTPLFSGQSQLQVLSSSIVPSSSNQALSFDPVAGLPARLVKRILEFKFVEMADMLPDAWQEDSQTGADTHPLSRRLIRRAPIAKIPMVGGICPVGLVFDVETPHQSR